MRAWAHELQLGAWFSLDHNGKVSHVRMMGPAQGNKVVEALKAWVHRTKNPAPGSRGATSGTVTKG